MYGDIGYKRARESGAALTRDSLGAATASERSSAEEGDVVNREVVVSETGIAVWVSVFSNMCEQETDMNDGKAVVEIIECDVNGMELAHRDVLRTKSNLVVELYAANEFPGSFVGFLTQYNGTIRGYRHLYAHGRVGRAVHDERQDAGGRTSEGGVVLDCEKHKHGIAQAWVVVTSIELLTAADDRTQPAHSPNSLSAIISPDNSDVQWVADGV
ncbi:hypothetical protein BC826DRAFT_1176653 [Russula brevipes]|nr:hypothetical protein BC826DRAFT_1176653 [Russula brevipes]